MRERFGIGEWRAGQREVVESVLGGHDTLAFMPTGAGKSLCYQLAGLRLPGITLVISPLIALMKDQVEKLDETGLAAAQFNSTVPAAAQSTALEEIGGERTEFVFATPERLTDPEFLAPLKSVGVSLVVVDEAHCISQWGHDFRPAFLEIAPALEALGHPRLLALTATATARVMADIGHALGRPGLRVIQVGLYRDNLDLVVKQVTGEAEKLFQLRRALEQAAGPVVVYTSTVKTAKAVHEALMPAGGPSATAPVLYHGQLSVRERTAAQDAFMSGTARVIVATNAFGMGIDKPDIRTIVHVQCPGSLDAYYQEAGRAGRDGARARCILLFDRRDLKVHRFFMGGRYPDKDDLSAVLDAVRRHGQEGATVAGLSTEISIPENKRRVALKLLLEAALVRRRSGRLFPGDAPGSKVERVLKEIAADYHRRSQQDHADLEEMQGYAYSARCRWATLLFHFGQHLPQPRCGHCDNCRHPPRAAQVRRSSGLRQSGPPRSAPPRYGKGETVVVPRYGEARVEDAAGGKVTVRTAGGQQHTFVESAVRRRSRSG